MATIYEHVTNAIVKALEAGTVPWVRPWSQDGKAAAAWGLPFNAARGSSYRGANIITLWGTAQAMGYHSQGWMTYKQANELGGQVRKGEHATWVHYWHWSEKVGKDGTKRRTATLMAYKVFNTDQIDGLPERINQRTEAQELGAGAIEDRVRALGVKVRLGGNSAYYDPNHDRIALPLPERFKSREAFHSTLAHETVHWTGGKSRLARDQSGRFGTDEYAREELVAELGSAFVLAQFGIALTGLQHVEYLASWLKVLRSDSRAILRAASAAQRACDLIMGDTFKPEGDDDTQVTREPDQEAPAEAPTVVVPMVPVSEPVQPVANT